ncbi:GRF1-interacting factor 1-like [Tripterygium wilfordii]|uniref:GRF1-interacting factor 1-like n=1 Tax=Tripterygium wilfordii TaxID=458696 RepID=A0A7J7CZR5_TRIWF|nr:GRF1-interacting factor 1-like [Tripterygium wilfordii]
MESASLILSSNLRIFHLYYSYHGSAGLHLLQSEGGNAGGSGALGVGAYADFGRGYSGEGLHIGSRGMAGGSKQDIGSTEGIGGSSGGQGGAGGETLYPKGGNDSH